MKKKKTHLSFLAILILHLALGGAFSKPTKIPYTKEKQTVKEKTFAKYKRLDYSPMLVNNYYKNKMLFPVNYDTLITDSKNYMEEEFLKLKRHENKNELLSLIKRKSSIVNKEFCALDEENLCQVLSSFNLLENIPFEIYRELLPVDERMEKEINIEFNEDKNQYLVTRKFEKFYGVIEKKNHIQLIVVGYGKYYPTVYLRTYRKETLAFISEAVLYEFKVKEDSVERIKGCCENPFDHLSVSVLNSIDSSATYVPDDTIKSNYTISSEGEIKQLLQN